MTDFRPRPLEIPAWIVVDPACYVDLTNWASDRGFQFIMDEHVKVFWCGQFDSPSFLYGIGVRFPTPQDELRHRTDLGKWIEEDPATRLAIGLSMTRPITDKERATYPAGTRT